MSTIFNGTPHTIVIIEKESVKFDSVIRKFVSNELPTVIESIPSNGVLNAQFEQTYGDAINGIPTSFKQVKSFDPIPDADVIICSGLYYKAVQDTKGDLSNLYTIIDPVFTPDGKTVIGCLYIGRV